MSTPDFSTAENNQDGNAVLPESDADADAGDWTSHAGRVMLKMEKQLALIETKPRLQYFPKRLSKLNKPTVSNIKPAESVPFSRFLHLARRKKSDQISAAANRPPGSYLAHRILF